MGNNNIKNTRKEIIPEDAIIVQIMSLHYGMEDCNPVEKISFWNDRVPDKVF